MSLNDRFKEETYIFVGKCNLLVSKIRVVLFSAPFHRSFGV